MTRSPLLQLASARFETLSVRERRALKLASVLVPAALLLLGIDLLISEHSRLAVQLPRTSHMVARMETESLELARLRANTRPLSSANAATLQASARARGMALSIRGEDGRFLLEGSADLNRLLPWLADQHAEFRLRVESLRIDGAGARAVSASLHVVDDQR